jgi:hypothetical protein
VIFTFGGENTNSAKEKIGYSARCQVILLKNERFEMYGGHHPFPYLVKMSTIPSLDISTSRLTALLLSNTVGHMHNIEVSTK